MLSRKKSALSDSDTVCSKKAKFSDTNILKKTLQESGLTLKYPPEKCVTSEETIIIIRNIKRNLQKDFGYPRNVSVLFTCLEKELKDWDIFKHYLYPNIIRINEELEEEQPVSDSVIKILLSVPIIQDKLIDLIFEKALDLAAESKCGKWIQMILKCLSSLDIIVSSEKVSANLITLLDTATEYNVRLEIITAIPDIIGDQEHDDIASELSRILSEDHELIPAILDCLSYLCLSDTSYEQLQKKTLNILTALPKFVYFPNFIKFLLMPGRLDENVYMEAVLGLRNVLRWPDLNIKPQDISSSQVLTANAIRNSMISSKVIASCWLKIVSSCKTNIDYKPIDFIILLILYSTSEEKQRQVENIIRKHVKTTTLKEELLLEVFIKYKPILKDYLKHMISLTNSLLKCKSDFLVESFANSIYTLMLSELEDCCSTIVAEILQLGLDRKQCVMNILLILNKVSAKDISILKPQSLQMLTLLDRMDDMIFPEIRAIMNLLTCLAYSFENSIIRDDLHMIIRKELSSCNPIIKIQGILAGVHAVKYLMNTNENEDNSVRLPDDVSYGSASNLLEGDLREAAQIIELISRSTRQFPDLIAFFYDELSSVISSGSRINKHFLAWLTDAVTNDLQQNFIIDSVENEKIGNHKISMQYCLNTDTEISEIIAINIGGIFLNLKSEINVIILSPLFQLVQTLHHKQNEGDLSSIDALLGCAVVMPCFDLDVIEDIDTNIVSNILDCHVHCINWFRELLNAFATQNDDDLKNKILKRIIQVEELENLVGEILMRSKISYKLPTCTFNINKYTGQQNDNKPKKIQNPKIQKKSNQNDTILPESAKSQLTQTSNSIKNKLAITQNLPLRHLKLNLLHILNINFSESKEAEDALNVKILTFVLKNVNGNIEQLLVSKIKRNTFLSKQDICEAYDPVKAEDCAKYVYEILPMFMRHFSSVTTIIENKIPVPQNYDSCISPDLLEFVDCLECMLNTLLFYFKWIEFKNHQTVLLKNSLKVISSISEDSNISLKELVTKVVEYFQRTTKCCVQFSVAVSLVELIQVIGLYSSSTHILKILQGIAQNFLSVQWKTVNGLPEKGQLFNQGIDRLAAIYFISNEVASLKSMTLQLANDIKELKNKTDTLKTLKSINKSNFSILYRNLGTALYEATNSSLRKELSNAEHIELWKDVTSILKYMSDIAKTFENRNNLSAFFKKSFPILKLFISHGIPLVELEFKNSTEEILEILKILQKSTRFLQSLCCHSRLKKDSSLMQKVPLMRQLLEILIYKVKASLVANNCSEAFWMGNLKNKNIHGEIIVSQESATSEESGEDCDEQLPDDESDSNDEMINPDSKSLSDIV